jgi:hypothetical protein
LKIKLLKTITVQGKGVVKVGEMVIVPEALGLLYIKLGNAVEVEPEPTTPTSPTTPTTPTNPTTPTEQAGPTTPSNPNNPTPTEPTKTPVETVKKPQGTQTYVPTRENEPQAQESHAIPEPEAKELPKPELPGEALYRETK